MSAISELKVFTTHPHACSYLPDEEATTLFIDPEAGIDRHLYTQLSEVGFRRSGPHLYRPHCRGCKACVPSRIPVAAFKPNRQQRRVWRRNADLSVIDEESGNSDEFYALYARYITERHRDGDMFPPDREQFDSFLTREWGVTRYFSFRREGRLLGVAVTDELDNGFSAIYTFFDPDEDSRSLGVYGILWQIEAARNLGLDYVYLGYWIKACRKMAYKINYRPIELYLSNRWVSLEKAGP